MSKRVVITGLGTINPLGHNISEYWDGMMAAKSGVSLVDRFDISEFSSKIAGQVVDPDFSDCFDKKELRRTSRFILFAVYAAMQAVKDAGLDVSAEADQIGVDIGSGVGGVEVFEESIRTLYDRGPSKVRPFTVPMMICDMAAGVVSMKIGAKGPNSCSVTACASSAHSMANAFRLIQHGNAVAMVTGGAEASVTPLSLASFCAARSLSDRNDDPQGASRPFDNDRNGFVMGEGSGILVFEELEHAKARGATIYAEVIGFGSSGDAYHLTAPAPEGEGAKRAMKMALDMAGVAPKDVGYVNAHGTSTVLNDKNETAAIKAVFGDYAYDLHISSIKSMTGHLLGAAAAIEMIASVLTIQNGMIPPTINYNTPDPDCDLNVTPNKPVSANVDIVMSNSFGFGGHNAVLLVKRFTS